MKALSEIQWLLIVPLVACTQTDDSVEGDPAPKCREEEMAIAPDLPSPIGIVPADWRTGLEDSAEYDVQWSDDGHGPLEVRFADLSSATLVTATADGSNDACEDFIAVNLMMGLKTTDEQFLDEMFEVTARVFAGGHARIEASLPKSEIRGELASANRPSSFDHLAVSLTLSGGEVRDLSITAESDGANQLGEWIAGWP